LKHAKILLKENRQLVDFIFFDEYFEKEWGNISEFIKKMPEINHEINSPKDVGLEPNLEQLLSCFKQSSEFKEKIKCSGQATGIPCGD